MSRAAVSLAISLVVTTISLSAWPAAADDRDIIVRVSKNGSEINVNVDCPVAAPVNVVWDVLIDYDHMTRFISNLDASTVRERDGNRLTVHQKGKATHGPLTVEFENVREVLLVPSSEIRSRVVSGNPKSGVFTTKIVELAGSVHILHTGQYSPKMWIPPLVGVALLEAETRKQFSEIRVESMRRKLSPGASTVR
jgi:hypothetical protein